MRVISRAKLRQFWETEGHEDSEEALRAWFKEAEQADWASPPSIKEKYGSASVLKAGRVVFNIRGNNYRLVVKVVYRSKTLYIRFIGTHEQYDRIDADTI